MSRFKLKTRGRRRDGGFPGSRLDRQELKLANEVVPTPGQSRLYPALRSRQRTSCGHLADALFLLSAFPADSRFAKFARLRLRPTPRLAMMSPDQSARRTASGAAHAVGKASLSSAMRRGLRCSCGIAQSLPTP